MSDEVRLGDRVRDKVTGFEGIATSRTRYITGCDSIGVQSSALNDKGGTVDVHYFDVNALDVIKSAAVVIDMPEPTELPG